MTETSESPGCPDPEIPVPAWQKTQYEVVREPVLVSIGGELSIPEEVQSGPVGSDPQISILVFGERL